MTTAIKKLIENIDQLVFWLKENPNTPIPTEEKNRLTVICDKIKNGSKVNYEEWEKLQPISEKLFKVNSEKNSIQAEYVICDLFGDKLNIKNIAKHKNKCRAKNKGQNKKITNPPKQKSTPTGATYADKPNFNEYKENRKLDGSRDFWQIRDQGKFGSHSSYDDMGDESFS